MTDGAPWKHIILFSIPVLLGSLLQQLYNTVDTIIVGNFSSEEALSAVGTTGTMTFFFLAIAIGLSSGCGVVVARDYGGQEFNKIRKDAASGITFLLLVGLISGIIGIIISFPTFKYLLAVPDELLNLTLVYYRVYCLGLVFQFGYNILSAILRALGDSKATLYFLFISSVMNVFLDLLFVAVFKWSVFGAAFATDISQFVSLAAAYIYMCKKYPIFRFKLNEYHMERKSVISTIEIGLPISTQLVIVSVGLTFIQRAVNEFGKAMTASFTVGQRIEQYINLPFNSLQTTLATYTGQNIGAGKLDRVKKGAKQGVLISIIITVCLSFIIYFSADKLAMLFNLSDEALLYCVPHIRTIAFINIILGAYIPLFGVYQGMGHSGFPAIVATCALTARVISVYALRYSDLFGCSIIWWNGLFGYSLGIIITWSYYLSHKWEKKV